MKMSAQPIDQSNDLPADVKSIRPRLKHGTILVPGPHHTYVGLGRQGIEVASESRAVLHSMDGRQTCQELSTSFALDIDEIYDLIQQLDQIHLLDTHSSKISVHRRFHSPNAHRASHDSDDSNDGAFQQLRAKLAPELAFTTWHHGVRDGGLSAMGARREWQIHIFGDCRISTLIYGILLASGVTRTELYDGNDIRCVREEDLCAGFLHPSDIGLSLQRRSQELSRELALFPPSKEGDEEMSQGNTLMVGIGSTPAEHIQQWMSQGIPHLLVDYPDGPFIDVGPIVIPGRTPCARCILLARQDQNLAWSEIVMQRLSSPQEVPVAVAHLVAGMVGLEILRFIDEHQSSLIGSSARIDYHQPTRMTEQKFGRHPACGCNW